MKKIKIIQMLKRVIIIAVIIGIIIVPHFNYIFAAINENYSGTEVITSMNVTGDEDSNILTKAIFWLINTCASIGESLLTSFAKVLASVGDGDTGAALMPWADAIIYNGVPALDVNFINPSAGSFSSIISDVIAKLYYTIFSISITFFTVAVLIMAIKLATTAIAAEKARYKETVADFVISLILIFSIHYFISFCFYLNESLVKVAFGIVDNQLSGSFTFAGAAQQQKNLIERVKDAKGTGNENWFHDDDNDDAFEKLSDYIAEALTDGGKYELAAKYLAGGYEDFLTEDNGNGLRKTNDTDRAVLLYCMAKAVYDHRETGVIFENKFGEDITYGDDYKEDDELYLVLKEAFDADIKNDCNIRRSFATIYKSCVDILSDNTYGKYEVTMMNAMTTAVAMLNSTGDVTPGQIDVSKLGNSVVSQLSVYFKINRYDEDGDISLVGVIVYTIFVFQSIMYFFAYLKRFFYIVILSFFGPFLVLYDFMAKAMGQRNSTLSKWIKEFCAIVFIQSLQAFLLTMVSSFIVEINDNVNQAPGLAIINIIALASMAKLEQLVSDMIGLKSSVSDVGLKGGAKMGAHGLAGGIATMAALRRLGDNGKKMLGGVRGIAAGSREQKNALADKNRRVAQYAELLSQGGGAEGSAGAGEAGEGAPGGSGGGTGTGNGGVSAGASGGRAPSIKDKHKYEDMLANCDAKIMEARNKKKAAIYQIASGVLETSGSVAGFVTGGTLAGTMHAAAGDFSLGDVLSDAVKGAGVGDVLGEAALSIPAGVASFGKDIKAGSGKKALINQIQQKQKIIKDAYRKAGFDVSDLE